MARARRNRHLIKGEGVKWSQEGLTTLYPMAEPFDRGAVTKVTKDGYMVAWDTGFLQALKKPVPAKDHYVVSAGSTSRSWPGTDFEGEAPRARNNKGKLMRFQRARRNMAYKFTDPQGVQHVSDTMAEHLALVQSFHGGYAAPSKPPRKPSGKKPRKDYGEVKDPGAPLTFGQAKTIGYSIGGMAAYCPQYAGGEMSHRDALSEMGLTKGIASEVLDALHKQGVAITGPWDFSKRNDQQMRKAQGILNKIGGISCPI